MDNYNQQLPGGGDDADYDYDVVIDTLQEKYDQLYKMNERNANCEFMGFGLMDDIRAEQMDELQAAIKMWKERQ